MEDLELDKIIQSRRNRFLTIVRNGDVKLDTLTAYQQKNIVLELLKKDEDYQIEFLTYLIDTCNEDCIRSLSTIFLSFKPLLRKISDMS